MTAGLKPARWPIRFRVHPEAGTHWRGGRRHYGLRPRRRPPFFHVRVFGDRATMLADIRRHPCLTGMADAWYEETGALSHGHILRRYPGGYDPGDLGIVWLCAETLGGGAVAHELLHAGLRWMEWRGLRRPRTIAEEERLCYAVGAMVTQFWNRLYARAGVARIRVAS